MVTTVKAPASQAQFQPILNQDPKNERVVKITAEFFKTLKPQSSKVFQAFVITALLAAAAALVIGLAANPVGWIATTLSVSTLAAKAILGVSITTALIGLNLIAYALASKKTRQMVAFEFTAARLLLLESKIVQWLFKVKTYDQIPLDIPGLVLEDTNSASRGAKLFLGALPNQYGFEQGLRDLGEKGAVFSVNEAFELAPLGLSLPFTTNDWQKKGIEHSGMIAFDHELLTPEQMDFAADQIHKWVQQGNTIFVHCRGGVGRSATVIAAYLMKYAFRNGERLSLEEICALIKKYRPRSTIFNKIPALLVYDAYLNIHDRPRNENFDALHGHVQALPRRKAPKALVKQAVDRGRLSLRFPFGPDTGLVKECATEYDEERRARL
jgi:protein-tyrosine phosphatase